MGHGTSRSQHLLRLFLVLGSKAYDTVTFFPVLSSSLICQSSISLVFFQGSAALWLLFGWAGQCSLRAAFRQCSAVFSAFLGAHKSSGSKWVCVTSSRELRSTCFIGFLSVQCFCNSRKTSEIVTLGQAGSTVILAAQLSFVNFVLREEFALMFQTFSRNDPPGKAPPSRGRSVLKKTPNVLTRCC